MKTASGDVDNLAPILKSMYNLIENVHNKCEETMCT
jgi:hypothetical protein